MDTLGVFNSASHSQHPSLHQAVLGTSLPCLRLYITVGIGNVAIWQVKTRLHKAVGYETARAIVHNISVALCSYTGGNRCKFLLHHVVLSSEREEEVFQY